MTLSGQTTKNAAQDHVSVSSELIQVVTITLGIVKHTYTATVVTRIQVKTSCFILFLLSLLYILPSD